MSNSYFYPKRKYLKKDISFMYIYFENGDYVFIKGLEVCNIKVNVYDKLVKHCNGVSPVVSDGYIKLKVLPKVSSAFSDSLVYNPKELQKNRKKYIEDRCTKESAIKEIWLFDSYNWHNVLIGNIKAKMEEEFLVFEFLPMESMREYCSENHTVNLSAINKKQILSIDLDFENCECFNFYNDEIKDINLNFKPKLEWGASDLYRSIESGYIKIKLDGELYRRNTFISNNAKPTLKLMEERLCGKKGFDNHDICHLYITYQYGFGQHPEECIEVNDINDNGIDIDTDDDDFVYTHYNGGCCKKLKDGSIVIAFGKTAKEICDKFN